MTRNAGKGLVFAAIVAAAGLGSIVRAQAPTPSAQTPKNWSYEVDKRGNRVARDNRLMKADGSWREEVRQGKCITVKERSATGEYRETRQCNPASPK